MAKNWGPVTDAVLAFAKAQSWRESYRIVLERRDELLTDAADEVLADLLTQYRGDENAIHILEHRRELLTRCRQRGVDAAVVGYLQPSAATPESELESLLQELSGLNAPGEVPRRIAVCRESSTLIDRNDQPELWAGLEVELGNSLLRNLQGNRAENIEEAISCYEQALKVFTREALPFDWAATQHNLANAYSNRIRGDKAKNLEEAISRYELALEVRTRPDCPVDWARTHQNLAIAYSNRIWNHVRGDRADDVEKAISHYGQALEVYTREDFPVKWAQIQRNLATACLNRDPGREEASSESDHSWASIGESIVEDGRRALERSIALGNIKSDNMKEAISRYEQALEVFTREDFPLEWARTQDNLANAYTERLSDAVDAFINAQTREKSKRIVEEYRDVLLTDAAEKLLAVHRSTSWTNHALAESRALLRRCRREGIGAAFAGLSQPPEAAPLELEALLQGLDSLRIAACREALTLVDRNDQPESRAWLHVKLGDSLEWNPQRDAARDREEAISHYELALEVYTREDFPVEWARIQNNLFRAYWYRIPGEKTENCKLALSHYEQSLEVYTREDFPVEWAQIQRDLADAYEDRLRGMWREGPVWTTPNWGPLRKAMADFDEFIKMAVLAFVNARTWDNCKRIVDERQDVLFTDAADKFLADLLTQYGDEHATRHTLEEHRALLRRCRREGINAAFYDRLGDPLAPSGNVLKDLMNELALWIPEKKEWITFAIFLFRDFWTHGSTPLSRSNRAEAEVLAESQAEADSHVALGDRLMKEPQADRARNVEEAISHFKRALEIYTPQGFVAESKWAMTYQKLAEAYEDRIRGDRAQNIEEAISYYELVFERTFQARTRKDSPSYWAATHHNLAGAYSNRIRGDREQNVEEAIRHYKLALEVRTKEKLPVEWASTQNGLAIAYEDRIKGDREQNVEEAIRRCRLALEVRTREKLPRQWAETRHNLAIAYLNRGGGERAENIEEAISHCEQALEVRTREDSPVDWATTQHSLALAYRYRIRGKRAENVEEAIRHYKLALEVRTPNTLPQDCLDTAYALGYLLYDEGRFAEARAALTTAHEAVEALRGELVREEAKQKLAEQNADLYARLVHCCLVEGDEDAAFEYAVAGKGRAFVDMLATARFDLSAAGADDPDLAEDLRLARELRQQVDNLLARLSGEGGTSPGEDGEERRYVRSQMRADLRSLQGQEAAHWEEMSYRYPALTATQQAPTLSAGEARALAGALAATLVEYYRHAGGWCAFVVSPEEVRSVSLSAVEEVAEDMLGWLAEIESPYGRNEWSYDSLRGLHEAVVAPLGDHLPRGGAVVLAPFSWLHLVPLSAALDPATSRYAAEDHLLGFTPNLAALRVALDQEARRYASSPQEAYRKLLGVAYPGAPGSDHYLPNVLPEAEAVARHFPEVTPLYRMNATPDAVVSRVRGQDVVHFGCHGTFDPEAPEQSGLMLSGGWLTVQRVITELRLDRTKLATIGACLSGRVHVRQAEEHVGLVQAMMSAGARAVVASLWPVNDAATRALFEAFYAGVEAGKSPAVALAGAARMVRERAGWEHPYYWAAFQPTGLAYGGDEPGSARLPDEVASRVEEARRESIESVRGGFKVDAEQIVENSQSLLRQMKRRPDKVRALLEDAGERERMAARLRALEEQAAGVQTEKELLELADAVHRLVEETPALARRLLPKEMDVEAARQQRWFYLEDAEASPEDLHVQESKAQILNDVREIRWEVEEAPQEELR